MIVILEYTILVIMDLKVQSILQLHRMLPKEHIDMEHFYQ